MNSMKLIGPFSQIVTLNGIAVKGAIDDDQLSVLENGGVLIESGKILEVGAFDALSKKTENIEEIESSAVLLPSFVDCHTHMVWGGSRAKDYALRMRGESYEKILEEGGGIFDSVEKTRSAAFENLSKTFLSRLDRQLSKGVTTIEVKSGYGLDLENELKMLEVVAGARSQSKVDLVSTCLAAHVCPKEFSDKGQYLQFVVKKLLPEIKQKGLATRVDAFIEPSAFPVDVASSYLKSAKELGFDLTLHADQFTPGGSQLAVDLSVQSADHLESSGEKEILALAKSNVIPVALPGASIGLGMWFTPARKLLDAGASLAIATDWNPGSAPMGDLMTQAAILGIYEKLSTAEVFAGMTFRAAAALGFHDRGKIEEGMKADLVAFATDDYREILYQQGQMSPSRVWKAGDCI